MISTDFRHFKWNSQDLGLCAPVRRTWHNKSIGENYALTPWINSCCNRNANPLIPDTVMWCNRNMQKPKPPNANLEIAALACATCATGSTVFIQNPWTSRKSAEIQGKPWEACISSDLSSFSVFSFRSSCFCEAMSFETVNAVMQHVCNAWMTGFPGKTPTHPTLAPWVNSTCPSASANSAALYSFLVTSAATVWKTSALVERCGTP